MKNRLGRCHVDGGPVPVNDRPTVKGLEHLHASLTQHERADLLEELLVATAHGGEAMAAVLDAWLVDRAGREFLDGLE